jgi:hypothetical protein
MVLCNLVLSQQEMAFACKEGRRRHEDSRTRGIRDAHGARPGDITLDDEFGGAAAEFAASKIFNVKWTAAHPNSPPDGPDIGNRTQVRHIARPSSKCLLVRPSDLQKYGNVPFVLVRRQGNQFTLLGWIMAEEAQGIVPLTDKGNGRPPAWFVPEYFLHSIEKLRNI